MQEGPKLQTFYTCKDRGSKCIYLYEEVNNDYNLLMCKKRQFSVHCSDIPLTYVNFVETPIDCPLLGKTQEYDVRFDKDVLMRNL
jgi:hypothetical protein